MTDVIEKPALNGVDTPTLLATINAVAGQRELADFTFRARASWVSGTHSRIVVDDFETALDALPITPSTYIVLVTRGHVHDVRSLRRIIDRPAAYIGMIGSRRRVFAVFKLLHQEGVPIVTIPKTMDNDVFGTDYCIGFSTAVTRSVEAVHQLRTPTGSHERIGVIELFGRNSGETALITGYLADVDRVLISEVPFDVDAMFAATCPAVSGCLALDEALAGRPRAEVFLKDGHWAAGGHRIAALRIAAYLRTLPGFGVGADRAEPASPPSS